LADILAASAVSRLFVWGYYLQSVVHGGLVGVGPGQSAILAPTLTTMAGGQTLKLLAAPENSWIALLVEIGAPATIALLVLLVRLVLGFKPTRISAAAPAMTAALVGCIGVYGLTDEHILPLVALIGGMASSLSMPKSV
jgi:hypothetical protein